MVLTAYTRAEWHRGSERRAVLRHSGGLDQATEKCELHSHDVPCPFHPTGKAADPQGFPWLPVVRSLVLSVCFALGVRFVLPWTPQGLKWGLSNGAEGLTLTFARQQKHLRVDLTYKKPSMGLTDNLEKSFAL